MILAGPRLTAKRAGQRGLDWYKEPWTNRVVNRMNVLIKLEFDP